MYEGAEVERKRRMFWFNLRDAQGSRLFTLQGLGTPPSRVLHRKEALGFRSVLCWSEQLSPTTFRGQWLAASDQGKCFWGTWMWGVDPVLPSGVPHLTGPGPAESSRVAPRRSRERKTVLSARAAVTDTADWGHPVTDVCFSQFWGWESGITVPAGLVLGRPSS